MFRSKSNDEVVRTTELPLRARGFGYRIGERRSSRQKKIWIGARGRAGSGWRLERFTKGLLRLPARALVRPLPPVLNFWL